jgi:hypothetical protein
MGYGHIGISKVSNESDDTWLKEFENKVAVQAVPSSSIYDQLNSILGNKSKYSSVDDAVREMKKRSGLTDYLEKLNNLDQSKMNEKTASDNNMIIDKEIPVESVENVPVIIKKCPNVKNTIENIIQGSRGNLTLLAIIDRAKSIHHNDISDAKDWEDPELLGYVSKLNLNEKQKYPILVDDSNLGNRDRSYSTDIDQSNTDAFYALNPAK